MASKIKLRKLFYKYEDGIRKLAKLEGIGLDALGSVFEYNETLYEVYNVKQEIEQNVNSDLDWIDYDPSSWWVQRHSNYSRIRE